MRYMFLILLVLLCSSWIVSAEDAGSLSVRTSNDPCYCNKFGNVTRVINGDTFYIDNLSAIKLAGIKGPDMSTQQGKNAKLYTESLVLGKSICFILYSIDNRSQAVAYLVNPNGSVNSTKSLNLILLDQNDLFMREIATLDNITYTLWGACDNITY
jgi:endonuclease YncB( thermonuclease family)